MLKATLVLLFGLTYTAISEGDDSDDHDHDHEDMYDCSCTTGIATEDLTCGDDAVIDDIQSFMVQNGCKQYCDAHEHAGETHLEYDGDTKLAWRCFQAFTALIQYHDYCPTGRVNETLIHEYYEVCPDCLQEHYQYENAVACDETLNCTDSVDQEDQINYVNANCISECGTGCAEAWRTAEGYHRVCDHDDLSETFDTLFDNLAWDETVCNQSLIHCNYEWEEDHTIDCSSELNEEFKENLDMYGAFDLDDVGESGTAQYFTVFGAILSVFAVFFV